MIELNQFEPDINRAQVWKAIKVVPTIDGNMNICLCSRLHAHCSEQKQFILKHHEIHKLPANPNYNNRGIPMFTYTHNYSTEFCHVDGPKVRTPICLDALINPLANCGTTKQA